jgi:hypothetical protein
VPLQQPLGVGEGAVLLDVSGGREEEHLGADVLGAQLAGLELGASYQNDALSISTTSRTTSQSSSASARRCRPGVGRADRRVLAVQEEAADLALEHVERRLVRGVVAADAGQAVEAEPVVRGGRVAEPRLHQADEVGAHVAPVAGGRRVLPDVVGSEVVVSPTFGIGM